jgi:uncharacterized membrane protein YdjX (TVP38/TMEM64 family)
MTNSSTDRSLKNKARLLAILVLGLLGLTAAWRLSSLNAWLDIQLLVVELRRLGAGFGPLTAIACISLASVMAIPLAIILLVSAIAFGPWLGLAYALSGACLGASISYGIGSYLGHDALCRLAGERVNLFSSRVGKRGVLSVMAIRLMPIAPFAIVNMIAGATHIRLGDFLIGSLLGMIPGGLAISLLGDRIAEMASSTQGSAILIVAVTLMIVAGWIAMKHWLTRQSKA